MGVIGSIAGAVIGASASKKAAKAQAAAADKAAESARLGFDYLKDNPLNQAAQSYGLPAMQMRNALLGIPDTPFPSPSAGIAAAPQQQVASQADPSATPVTGTGNPFQDGWNQSQGLGAATVDPSDPSDPNAPATGADLRAAAIAQSRGLGAGGLTPQPGEDFAQMLQDANTNEEFMQWYMKTPEFREFSRSRGQPLMHNPTTIEAYRRWTAEKNGWDAQAAAQAGGLGAGVGGVGPDGQPLTAEQAAQDAFARYRASTGYQFRLNEGLGGISQNAAASGLLGSGATAKALQQYGQNIASAEFSNYLNQLGGVQQTGLDAASNVASQGQSSGQAAASIFQQQGAAAAQHRLDQGQIWAGAAGTLTRGLEDWFS